MRSNAVLVGNKLQYSSLCSAYAYCFFSNDYQCLITVISSTRVQETRLMMKAHDCEEKRNKEHQYKCLKYYCESFRSRQAQVFFLRTHMTSILYFILIEALSNQSKEKKNKKTKRLKSILLKAARRKRLKKRVWRHWC